MHPKPQAPWVLYQMDEVKKKSLIENFNILYLILAPVKNLG